MRAVSVKGNRLILVEDTLVNIQEEIFRTIENLTKQNSSSALYDIPTIILRAEGNNKFKVKINGAERTVKDGIGLNLQPGSAVWVHAMNGNLSELYVISKR